MDNATFESEINEHIQKLQDLNKQMGEISKKIGALQEEGRALHGAALEVKGAIEALARMKAKQDEKAAKAKAGLILADKSLVAADGQTVLVDANAAPAANADGTVPNAVEPEKATTAAPAAEAPAAPVIEGGLPASEIQPTALEVVQ